MLMITINDIARELGLSTATISNALSGKGRVSANRRREILDAAKRMGYDFNRVRVNPPQKTLAVFVETLSVFFCTKIAEGVIRAANDSGFQTRLFDLDISDDYNPPCERVRGRIEQFMPQLDATTSGAVYISQYPRDVTGVVPALSIPIVYAYCYTNDGAPSVNTDDQQGAYIAVRHLLGLGKQRIAMMSGPINSIPMTKRFSGYQRALIDAGMSVDLRMVRLGDWDIGHSRDHMRELLEQGLQPDGVFCQSDHIALGVCQAIRDAGLRIPQDIAVVGFDNYDFARFVSPALSTIDQPLEQIGGVAFAQLQRMIDGQAIRDRSVLLEAKLVTRHSA